MVVPPPASTGHPGTGLAAFAAALVAVQFTSRAWFIMLAVSFLLVTSLLLAVSRYGRIKLGRDDDRPEFSTLSWLTMLFAAGMGVVLLYWGTAEPLTHYLLIADYTDARQAAGQALCVPRQARGEEAQDEGEPLQARLLILSLLIPSLSRDEG